MRGIYLSLGSNIGDRAQNIAQALELLPAHGVRVVKQSALYETEPVELREQDWFLNAVAEVETDLQPQQLMQALLTIEQSMGRERLIPKGPRIIDLDILLFGSTVTKAPQLEIPHPRFTERRFVLVPFAEIAPQAVHPRRGQTIQQLLDITPDHSEVRRA
ncbi:MAG TPA: 2-amino-4-hydroxy-6-hydroxymethyldihydropteridine diphosphokinase [Candidatus Acidoferrales bacterium]